MATSTQQGDFDRVKRWGKEFLAAGEAGTGQGRRRPDATAGPQGDAGQITARTTRFNPPPGWPGPHLLDGWLLPAGSRILPGPRRLRDGSCG